MGSKYRPCKPCGFCGRLHRGLCMIVRGPRVVEPADHAYTGPCKVRVIAPGVGGADFGHSLLHRELRERGQRGARSKIRGMA